MRVKSCSWFIWFYFKRVLLFSSYYSCYISHSKHKQIFFNVKGQVSQIYTEINVKEKRKEIALIANKAAWNCGRIRPCSARSFHTNVWALHTKFSTETCHRITDLTVSLVCWNSPIFCQPQMHLKAWKKTSQKNLPYLVLALPPNNLNFFFHCMPCAVNQQDLWMRKGLFFRRAPHVVSHNVLYAI